MNDKENKLEKIIQEKTDLIEKANKDFNELVLGKKLENSDIVRMFSFFHSIVNIQDQLLTLAINDLFIASDRFNVLENDIFKLNQKLSSLTTALVDKGTIASEDISKAWIEKVKPLLEEHIKGLQDKLAEELKETESK